MIRDSAQVKRITAGLSAPVFATVLFVAFMMPVTTQANKLHPYKGLTVRTGRSLFVANRSNLYKIYNSGTSIKLISKGVTSYNIFKYGNKIFYETKNGIYCYDNSKGSTQQLTSSCREIVDVCKAGVITNSYDAGLTLCSFNGRIKRIARGNCQYIGRAAKRILFMKRIGYKRKQRKTWYRVFSCGLDGSRPVAKSKFSIKVPDIGSKYHECVDFYSYRKISEN